MYITDEGETRSSAFKRKFDSVEEERDTLQRLFSYIQSRPQSEAQSIMARIQLCQDPAEATQLLFSEGDNINIGNGETFAETEASHVFIPPTRATIGPALLRDFVKVPAYPWTTVAGDEVVSEILSQFFIDERPLALPIVNYEKFVGEMKACEPGGATCCTPLLVNAICAQQCVSLFDFGRKNNVS